ALGRRHFEVVEELGEYDEFPGGMIWSILEERRGQIDVEALLRYVAKTNAHELMGHGTLAY
ncbi:MAG: hypothetical protein Q8Q14_11250, partial [Gemmatimonadales bacterium]|nr:hypothetical protein [Gemmatimonadales bacterium]